MCKFTVMKGGLVKESSWSGLICCPLESEEPQGAFTKFVILQAQNAADQMT